LDKDTSTFEYIYSNPKNWGNKADILAKTAYMRIPVKVGHLTGAKWATRKDSQWSGAGLNKV